MKRYFVLYRLLLSRQNLVNSAGLWQYLDPRLSREPHLLSVVSSRQQFLSQAGVRQISATSRVLLRRIREVLYFIGAFLVTIWNNLATGGFKLVTVGFKGNQIGCYLLCRVSQLPVVYGTFRRICRLGVETESEMRILLIGKLHFSIHDYGMGFVRA